MSKIQNYKTSNIKYLNVFVSILWPTTWTFQKLVQFKCGMSGCCEHHDAHNHKKWKHSNNWMFRPCGANPEAPIFQFFFRTAGEKGRIPPFCEKERVRQFLFDRVNSFFLRLRMCPSFSVSVRACVNVVTFFTPLHLHSWKYLSSHTRNFCIISPESTDTCTVSAMGARMLTNRRFFISTPISGQNNQDPAKDTEFQKMAIMIFLSELILALA